MIEPQYPPQVIITVSAHPTDNVGEAQIRIKFTGPDDLSLAETIELMRGAVTLMELEQDRQADAVPPRFV